MELFSIFTSTFLLVFIGELGDKTQIATGTGTLANRMHTRVVFSSSALALTSVAGLTVFFASILPRDWIPFIEYTGGILLIAYGGYLFLTAGIEDEDEALSTSNGWKLFLTHFVVVFIAELGDKTQIATLAVAIENRDYLLPVFFGSATALVAVTALTVWGVTKISTDLVPLIQKLGAVLLMLYGIYMVLF